MSDLDFKLYEKLLKKVGALSKLYSDSEIPYLGPRFIEKLFIIASNSEDLTRTDMSFDAKMPNGGGVGIKTFIAGENSKIKSEKIAEFNAKKYDLKSDSGSKLKYAKKIADYRNSRILSDLRIYDVNLPNSIYHCLIRTKKGCFIHEEQYELIDINSIKLNSKLNSSSHIHFNDKNNRYIFNTAKSTLYKYFDFSKGSNSKNVKIRINEDIFDSLIQGEIFSRLFSKEGFMPGNLFRGVNLEDAEFILLPLYSTSTGTVSEKSGINQWNAGGRNRKFGEGYIPVPSLIHKYFPNFFPKKDINFKISTPDERKLNVKICQQGGKALMSNPNNLLCDWLFRMIDESELKSRKRQMLSQPYTYEDLLKIGKDSVKIYKIRNSENDFSYFLEPASIGSYEEFISNL